MDPKLQQALADIINLLKAGAEQAAAVGREQLPILVQEYLRWGMTEAVMHASIGILTLIPLGLLTRWCFKNMGKWWERNDHPLGMLGFAGGVAIAAAVLFESIIPNILTAVQIAIAPRVYLLEQVRDLVR